MQLYPYNRKGSKSSLQRFKNHMPQRPVLAPFLFNIYMYELPDTISRTYAYADDLAILHSPRDWFSLDIKSRPNCYIKLPPEIEVEA